MFRDDVLAATQIGRAATQIGRIVPRHQDGGPISVGPWPRVVLVMCLALWQSGCAGERNYVSVRSKPNNRVASSLRLFSPSGPKPSPRTQQLLRRYDLSPERRTDRSQLLARLEELRDSDDLTITDDVQEIAEIEYALAELSYLTARESARRDPGKALDYYLATCFYAHEYLWHGDGIEQINAYDPQFRGASDLYNQALEESLRLLASQGLLRPGTAHNVSASEFACNCAIVERAKGWHPEDFDRFEFVSDYQLQGLRNHYHDYGLGVPLIALRKSHIDSTPDEAFYPKNLAFPITAFLRVSEEPTPETTEAAAETKATEEALAAYHPAQHRWKLVIELLDPLESRTVEVGDRDIPLETDFSTPIAYFLNQPDLSENRISTLGLIKPDRVKQLQGLYMLEPFRPDKMPVVLVHGLWSSPLTWMEMYNDLHSDPAIRDHYQFWFYFYPTGQPFWISAAQMRDDIAQMRQAIDPADRFSALDQMVLIGHSMGGLVSRLQSVESQNDFWQVLSEKPIEELEGDQELRESLSKTFFFRPNPSVRRVVTIGTPHRGSNFANDTTRWLGRHLIRVPRRLASMREQLLARNHNFFRPGAPLDITTSIDSLAPSSPLLPALLQARSGAWVSYHNIIGHTDGTVWSNWIVGEGDGVVSLASASLDSVPQLRSEITVPSEHVSVHRHPQAVLEVRRILIEQLREMRNFPYGIQVVSK